MPQVSWPWRQCGTLPVTSSRQPQRLAAPSQCACTSYRAQVVNHGAVRCYRDRLGADGLQCCPRKTRGIK